MGDEHPEQERQCPVIEDRLLDYLPLWAFFLATLGITAAAVECGFRFGRYRKKKLEVEKTKEESVASVVAATLGLLAFLLAFTFGFAASRYDSRREALREEINSIQTAFLRAEFLSEPQRARTRGLLREYVDVRLEAIAPGSSLADAIRKSEKLQREIWKQAVEVVRDLRKENSTVSEEMMSLFVGSLNDVIEAHAKRIAEVTRGRVPTVIWIGLFVITTISLFSMGYEIGIADSPRPVVGFGLIICFAVTMWLIADLDRPRAGLIRVSHQGMIDLRGSMNEESP
jgi:hypothetical protein